MERHTRKEDGRPADQWYWDDWFSSHDVQSCSFAAQGLWINLLGIMFSSQIRGTLAINLIQMDNKTIAKRFGKRLIEVNKLITELEEARVFDRLEDGTIISRRMFRKSQKKEQISEIRSIAGKKGMGSRWKEEDNKTPKINNKAYNKDITKLTEVGDNKNNHKAITNITTSSPTPTSSPTSSPKKRSYFVEQYSTIIAYLNEKTGKNFSPKTEPTIKNINARLKEGHTINDFKHVIDVKVADWKGDKEYNKYLRPGTLFTPKNFESYLNEEIKLTKSEEDLKKIREDVNENT